MLEMRNIVRVLMVLALGTVVSCAAVGKLNLLTTEDEVSIGRQAAREIEQQVRLYDDPVVAAYIDSLGQALVRHSRRSNLRYYFKVVDTDVVNAFALPGGWLYVNLGLITTAENESELAGVVGHEIGHVVGRHGARQISKAFGLGMLLELAVGENPSAARQVAGQFAEMGAGLTLLKYGRDAEREADFFAVEETYAAGIDPEGMATFFEKLMAMHESQPKGVEVWFSTHPPSQERIANVRTQIQKLSLRRGLKADSKRFQQIKARILKRQKPGARGQGSGAKGQGAGRTRRR